MMSSNVNMSSLAYLYVEKNAKEGMSPEELYTMYNDALNKLKELYKRDHKREPLT